ncbi:alpha-tubulin suppressor-like RCC1 family protein [Nakamurella sp. UYEF19]|uniref:RCC1 domain-containing protein n=1 Tax=Nakamurella sp. UYEF19 TaxID=1756392 RepID=UPI003391E5B6
MSRNEDPMRRHLELLLALSLVCAATPMLSPSANAAVPDKVSAPTVSAPSAPARAAALPSSAVGWGGGSQGQLGNGNLASSNAPVLVVGPVAPLDTTAISSGIDHACSVSRGRAYCWGRNDRGQLGNGGTVQSDAAVAVDTSGVLAGRTVTAISAGGFHTCAIADGLVFCWGYGFAGELGNGLSGLPSASSTVPIQVPGFGSAATEISTGHYRSCAIAGGATFCWGSNDYGQLGQPGNVSLRSLPVLVAGFPGGTQSGIAGGDLFSCLLVSGRPYCWGAGSDGQRGDGTRVSIQPLPTAVPVKGAIGNLPVTAISAGQVHACAIAGGKPFCWGDNASGELGTGVLSAAVTTPVAVIVSGVLSGKVSTAVAAGGGHSCVVAAGAPYCWGGATNGQIGDGDSSGASNRPSPLAARTGDVLAGRKVSAISAGWGTTMAIAGPREPGSFVTVGPVRLLDTRSALGINSTSPVPTTGRISVQVAGRGGVPAVGVKAVTLTLTVTAPTSAGYITVYAGSLRPTSSNINFARGRTIANSVVVPVGLDGTIKLYNGSPGTVHLLVDVAGYWFAGLPQSPGSFGALTPKRILDTRTAQAVAAGTTRLLVTGGVGGVPAVSLTPVVLNLTVVAPQTGGYLTVYCDGSVRPLASNLNFKARQTIANLVVTPACNGGRVVLFNGSGGSLHLLADVLGYFSPGIATARGAFGAVTPVRMLDTRRGQPVGPGLAISLPLAGRGQVPQTGVSAILLTLTVTAPTAAGFVTVYPFGVARPVVSQLNFTVGGTIANLVTAPVTANGKVLLFNGSAGSTQFIVDVVGYYLVN